MTVWSRTRLVRFLNSDQVQRASKKFKLRLVNMARTKQTARRSTGGPAPAKSLLLALAPSAAATTPPSKRVLTRSGTAPTRNTQLAACKDDPHAHVSFSPPVFFCSLKLILQWCSICHNGGDLMLCSTCNRGVCLNSCLPADIPADAQREAIFTCPNCWRKNKETRWEPYTVSTTNPHANQAYSPKN